MGHLIKWIKSGVNSGVNFSVNSDVNPVLSFVVKWLDGLSHLYMNKDGDLDYCCVVEFSRFNRRLSFV